MPTLGSKTGPLVSRLCDRNENRTERSREENDPRTDTRAAAAHLVGVLWASASQGLAVRELRAAVGPSREDFEDPTCTSQRSRQWDWRCSGMATSCGRSGRPRSPRPSSGISAIPGWWRSAMRRSKCWPSSPIGSRSPAPASSSSAAPQRQRHGKGGRAGADRGGAQLP